MLIISPGNPQGFPVCINRPQMFIDYAELMVEDEIPMSMVDWLRETDNFLQNNRRKVLVGKGKVSHEDAVKKAEDVY